MSTDCISTNDLLKMSNCLCAGCEQVDKNLFEMANLKEYRHSAILGYLLNRKEQGQRVHLNSFLARIFGVRKPALAGKVEVQCEKRVSSGGRERPIDILVTEEKKFALIIENKCRGALDQNVQIFDYWRGVRDDLKFREEDIFVLYLPPLNAFSAPSPDSLGELMKRFSANGNLAGHLMTYSYRDLILPWLAEDVLPNVTYGAGMLADSLRCYIGLLETMFAVRSESGDVRVRARKEFGEYLGQIDSIKLWKSTTDYLNYIDKVLSSNAQEQLSEKNANQLGALQSKLWEIRSVLREDNPLLDPANLSYEVYWLLRKNPTPFASKYIRKSLDAGLFFQTGRKQSAWDSVSYKGHSIECWFHADEYVKYCKGVEPCGAILTFGISGLGGSDCKRLEEYCQKGDFGHEYLSDRQWLSMFSKNKKFEESKKIVGGEMLWEIAKIVSKEAKRFSDIIEAEFN